MQFAFIRNIRERLTLFFSSLFMWVIIVGFNLIVFEAVDANPLNLVITLSLASLSLYLAYTSDQRMRALSNEKFLDVVGVFEDRRLNLLEMNRRIHNLLQHNQDIADILEQFRQRLSFSMWKGVTDLRRLEVLRQWVEERHQPRVINWTINFFNDIHIYLTQIQGLTLTNDNRNHIDSMYDMVTNYPIYEEDRRLRRRIDTAYNRLME